MSNELRIEDIMRCPTPDDLARLERAVIASRKFSAMVPDGKVSVRLEWTEERHYSVDAVVDADEWEEFMEENGGDPDGADIANFADSLPEFCNDYDVDFGMMTNVDVLAVGRGVDDDGFPVGEEE